MEPQPGPSSAPDFLSPVNKRQCKPLSAAEKLMVMNVYKTYYKTWPDDEYWSLTHCLKKTADTLGISTTTVMKVVKQHKMSPSFNESQERTPRSTIIDNLDDFSLDAIRQIVHQFYRKNEAPTLNKVLQLINEDPDLPNLSRTTLYRVLKKLNFKYMSRKRDSCLIERNDIIIWRQKYLQEIKQCRKDGKFIYYQDETWINAGHTVNKTWVDTKSQSSRQAFLEGLTTGLKAPTGKGRRLIICHLGSEQGFVDRGLLIFESKRNSGDYHQEMNSDCFEKWFQETLPKLKPNSVLVLDNAPYHTRKLNKTPTTSWRKAKIQEWLQEKNIQYETGAVKAQLLEIVKQNKPSHTKYVVDELAAQYGVNILRLPPYHCELNPIELIWAQVKGHVARNNKTFKMNEVKDLLKEGLREVTPQKWVECINHIKKIEKKMCQLDHIIDDVVDRIVVNINESDDSISDSSENAI